MIHFQMIDYSILGCVLLFYFFHQIDKYVLPFLTQQLLSPLETQHISM